MLNVVFLVGMVLFAASSLYFYVTGRKERGLNSAFLVSFVTLISYVLMWQGDLTVTSRSGQPIFWSRWLFYGLSCTLLMVEIARLRGIEGGNLVQVLYLTAIVMFTGFLAARDATVVRWIHFVISSVAYGLLLERVMPAPEEGSRWVDKYILFGWTVFPLVFVLAPTGFGVIGSAIANLLYLLLDIYTKIAFNVELSASS